MKAYSMPMVARSISKGILAGLLACALSSAAPTSVALADDPVVLFEQGNPEMNAAIRAARATLDDFLEDLANGMIPREGAAVKVAVPKSHGNAAEHLWMAQITRHGERFEASVDNEPVAVETLKIGDRYAFSRDQISDWNFWSDGALHGAYTLRVMLPRLSPDRADYYRNILVPLP